MSTLKKEGDQVKQQANGKWNMLGHIDHNYEALIVQRNSNTHLLRTLNGYGISKEALESGWFKYVVINENNNTRYFMVPVDDYLAKGIPFNAKGYEAQMVLSLTQLENYDLEVLRAQQDAKDS